MPSISNCADRHVIVDKRDGHYLSFPDIVRAADGRLVVAYREGDAHVAKRAKLLCKTSEDDGRTWSDITVLNATTGHCPRISRLSDGHLVTIDDASSSLYWSLDNGRHWVQQPGTGLQHGIPDRILELGPETFLTVAQRSRGQAPRENLGQTPHENMAYLSEDRGRKWQPLSVVAAERDLALCETSVTRLPDSRLLALMRENSCVNEPLYMALSADDGRTWTDPAPTPAVGHRPCVGVTESGKILVTYRNVTPWRGTGAWLGSLDELQQDFMVHGVCFPGDDPTVDNEGLRLVTEPGESRFIQYALRPITDPVHSRAELTVEVRVDRAEQNACAVHMGIWWRIFPDHITMDYHDDCIPLPAGQFNRLRFEYAGGIVRLSVNDELKGEYAVNGQHRDTRLIAFGNAFQVHPSEMPPDVAQDSRFRLLELSIDEPQHLRKYHWRWTPEEGLPDAQARARVLELKSDRLASWGDFGYSGWIQMPDGDFLCAYHHGGCDEPGYTPGKSAHILVTRFRESDFGA